MSQERQPEPQPNPQRNKVLPVYIHEALHDGLKAYARVNGVTLIKANERAIRMFLRYEMRFGSLTSEALRKNKRITEDD